MSVIKKNTNGLNLKSVSGEKAARINFGLVKYHNTTTSRARARVCVCVCVAQIADTAHTVMCF